jgi:hypothetical protein
LSCACFVGKIRHYQQTILAIQHCDRRVSRAPEFGTLALIAIED